MKQIIKRTMVHIILVMVPVFFGFLIRQSSSSRVDIILCCLQVLSSGAFLFPQRWRKKHDEDEDDMGVNALPPLLIIELNML